jgi:hypothetical protein
MAFDAFANDSDVLNIGGDAFTVSNDPACIVCAGSLELTRDQDGLKRALALQQAVNAIVAVLQGDAALPRHIAVQAANPGAKIDNPFL